MFSSERSLEFLAEYYVPACYLLCQKNRVDCVDLAVAAWVAGGGHRCQINFCVFIRAEICVRCAVFIAINSFQIRAFIEC